MGSDYRGFYEVFAGFYDALREVRAGETEFYVAQAASCRGAVLEVGCGTGRVLIPVAESVSDVWGIDSSAAMLGVLEGKLARLSRTRAGSTLRVTLRRADMRDFSLDRLFAMVMIPFHTFQHLVSRDEQLACLCCIRRHLEHGGRLVMDVAGFDPASVAHGGPIRLERSDSIRHPDMAGELESGFSVEVDPATGRAIQTRTVRRGSEELLRASVEVKYLRAGELEAVLDAAGFRVLERLGGFRGEPLVSGGEQVWIAEPRVSPSSRPGNPG